MGCDIHAFIEYDIGEGDFSKIWDIVPMELDLGRNYYLFHAMAGVRNGPFDNKIEPRGFPEKASCNTKWEYEKWGLDAHTPSWLTADEFRSIVIDMGDEVSDTVKVTYHIMDMIHHKLGFNTRIVFWFDN